MKQRKLQRGKREALIEAREEIHKSRVELEREVRERRSEIKGPKDVFSRRTKPSKEDGHPGEEG